MNRKQRRKTKALAKRFEIDFADIDKRCDIQSGRQAKEDRHGVRQRGGAQSGREPLARR
jgi:hypothetical protein